MAVESAVGRAQSSLTGVAGATKCLCMAGLCRLSRLNLKLQTQGVSLLVNQCYITCDSDKSDRARSDALCTHNTKISVFGRFATTTPLVFAPAVHTSI